MKFVKQAITDYTSAQLTETVAAWSSTVSYTVDDQVRYSNYIWASSSTSNLGNTPSDGSLVWVKVGVSNKYSLIDTRSTSETIVASDLVVTFDLGDINTLVIGNYTATSLTIENIDASDNILATQTFEQSVNVGVYDVWSYMYAPYSIETGRASYFDIVRIGTKLRVTFTKGTLDVVKCGYLIGGQAIDMGKTLEGVKLGWSSYSVRDTDAYGVITIDKRAAQDIVDFETIIKKSLMISTRRTAKKYRDDVVAFIVDDASESPFENLITLGLIQDADPLATNDEYSTFTWSILEAI